ncbi:MAG: T9SS type A sorting domain-containing protein [Chitinophagales bacterium]
MKKLFYLLFTIFGMPCFSQQVPFFISLQQADAPGLPYIHSYAKAQSGDKWLIVAGRVDGLHSLFPNLAFSFTEQNNNIFVIDTSTWDVWQSSLNNVPYEVRRSLSATNTQFRQAGNQLYIIGGYGYDSINELKRTFSTLTALDVDGLIGEITSGGNAISQYVRQVNDTVFAVTGGKLEAVGGKWYIAGGQNFGGLYSKTDQGLFTQRYTNSISSFDLNDDGINLSVSNFSSLTDTVNFHRRDLNSAPWISASGEEGFGVYGGVFQYEHNLPYRNPVYTTMGVSVVDFSMEQKMSQYQCPVMPLFDSVSNDMYTIFIGGISLYFFDSVSQTLLEDTLVPFIRDISSLIHHADGTTDEVLLPIQLPERSAANAEFFASLSLPHFENGVFKLRAFTQPVMLGYIYGGIISTAGNDGSTNASNKVYRVMLYPDFGSGISFAGNEKFLLYPNPADDVTQLLLNIPVSLIESITVTDAMNHVVKKIDLQRSAEAASRIIIGTTGYVPGIYAIVIKTAASFYSLRLVIVR